MPPPAHTLTQSHCPVLGCLLAYDNAWRVRGGLWIIAAGAPSPRRVPAGCSLTVLPSPVPGYRTAETAPAVAAQTPRPALILAVARRNQPEAAAVHSRPVVWRAKACMVSRRGPHQAVPQAAQATNKQHTLNPPKPRQPDVSLPARPHDATAVSTQYGNAICLLLLPPPNIHNGIVAACRT